MGGRVAKVSREAADVSQLRLGRGRAVGDYAGIRKWVPLTALFSPAIPLL